MLDDDAVESDWKNRNKPPASSLDKKKKEEEPKREEEPKTGQKPKTDLDAAQAKVDEKKAKLAELRGEPVAPETPEEKKERELAVSRLVGDAINNVVDKLNVEALSDCDDDDYTVSEECAEDFVEPLEPKGEPERKPEPPAEEPKAEAEKTELPPLPRLAPRRGRTPCSAPIPTPRASPNPWMRFPRNRRAGGRRPRCSNPGSTS